MEKFIKIYYSLLHSDLAHSSQLIYSFLLYAYEMNNKLKTIEWAKRETDEALRQFKEYYGLPTDSLLNR
nr:hypothetical protein DLTAUQXX_DLTAUQXX_CDS_0057 [uncultured phage]